MRARATALTRRTAFVAVAIAIAPAIVTNGCTRPRHGGALPPAPTAAARAGEAQSASDALAAATPSVPVERVVFGTATADPAPNLDIAVPVAGALLASPVRVSGVVQHQAGLLYVAQIVVAGAQPVQRGNARLTLAEDGSFSVDVPYTLDAAADGTVEISAVDPVSGSVAETERMAVRLAAAR